MTFEEFSEIVDTYGSQDHRWPDHLRQQCLLYAEGSSEAKEFIKQHQELEFLLNKVEAPEFAGLESRIANMPLPERKQNFLDQILNWLFPEDGFTKQLWRPAMAACLPLVFGIAMGNFFSFGVEIEIDGFETWDDELYMLSLNDYSENLF